MVKEADAICNVVRKFNKGITYHFAEECGPLLDQVHALVEEMDDFNGEWFSNKQRPKRDITHEIQKQINEFTYSESNTQQAELRATIQQKLQNNSIFTSTKSRLLLNNLPTTQHIKNSRHKRGLMNVIGTISKALFGTLTEEDAQQFLEKFNDLDERGLQRDMIMRKQTT